MFSGVKVHTKHFPQKKNLGEYKTNKLSHTGGAKFLFFLVSSEPHKESFL